MVEQDRPQLPEKKTNKLSPIQRAALATTAFFSILAGSHGSIQGLNEELSNSKEPTSASLPLPPDISQMVSTGNSKIAIDKDGIPLGYVLAEGTVGVFDQKEMRQLKEKAINTKEPQVIAMFPLVMEVNVNDFEFQDHFKSGHHEVFSLPDDVLSPEELEKRGVRIIQADNTHLAIRGGAFSKGAPLEDFNNTGRRLSIVLINGPFLSRLFMNDSRYDGFRNYLEEKPADIAGYKSRNIKELTTYLEDLRAKLEEISRSERTAEEKTSEMQGYRKEILRSKVNLFAYERALTPDQIRELIEYRSFKDNIVLTGGYNKGPETILKKEVLGADGKLSTITKILHNDPVVFIAVGKSTGLRREALFFNEHGNLAVVQTIGLGVNINMIPKPSQSYPNPKDFIRNPKASPDKPESYPFGGGQAAGFDLNHELKHDELIAQKINKGEKPNESEYDTDMNAMQEIQAAWDRWVKSGFKDNSGYYFLFRLPDGSYILTENKNHAPTQTQFVQI